MTKFAQLKNALKWDLFAHTNSGIILNNANAESTSHVFGLYSYGKLIKSNVTTKTISPYIFDRSYSIDEFILDPKSKFVTSYIDNKVQSKFTIRVY